MTSFKAGQEVFLRYAKRYTREGDNHQIIRGRVTKVGRKYVYVMMENYLWETKYTIEHPHEQVFDEGYSPDYFLHTSRESAVAYWRCQEAMARMQKDFSILYSFVEDRDDDELLTYAQKMEEAEELLHELVKIRF